MCKSLCFSNAYNLKEVKKNHKNGRCKDAHVVDVKYTRAFSYEICRKLLLFLDSKYGEHKICISISKIPF